MTTAQIVNIVLVVLCAVLFGVELYFKTRGSATEAATHLIAEIEQSGLLGKDKMAYVVSQLYELIPAPLKAVFTPDRLQILAQEVFDNMKKYALEYLQKLDDKDKPETPEEEPAEGDAE